MEKKHEKPEFQVICLDETNAKFYAASGAIENATGENNASDYNSSINHL